MSGITIKEASKVTQITTQGLHKFIRENKIEVIKTGNTFYISPKNFSRILQLRGVNPISKVISITCVKGGVGKTTLTNAIGTKMADLGSRVLLVDLDQQANLTASLGMSAPLKNTITLIDVFRGHFHGKEINIKDSIVSVDEYLDLIPSNLGLSSFENEFSAKTENIASYFSNMFKPIRNNYDIILIDTPPSLNKLTSAMHAFSNLVLIPINMDQFSLDGMDLTLSSLSSLYEKFNSKPDIKIIVNKFDARQKLGFEIMNTLFSSELKDFLSSNYISTSKNIDNAIAAKKSIWDPAYKSVAQDNLLDLTLEILEIDELKPKNKKTEVKITTKQEIKIQGETYVN